MGSGIAPHEDYRGGPSKTGWSDGAAGIALHENCRSLENERIGRKLPQTNWRKHQDYSDSKLETFNKCAGKQKKQCEGRSHCFFHGKHIIVSSGIESMN